MLLGRIRSFKEPKFIILAFYSPNTDLGLKKAKQIMSRDSRVGKISKVWCRLKKDRLRKPTSSNSSQNWAYKTLDYDLYLMEDMADEQCRNRFLHNAAQCSVASSKRRLGYLETGTKSFITL